MSHLVITHKQDCCGCEACVQICPKDAIVFSRDSLGFGYPHVDTGKCIDCGRCINVCPIINQSEPGRPLEVIGARNTQKKDLLKSSSGGIFRLLAEKILKEDGIVCGAAFDKDWNVCHMCVDNMQSASAFQGSKYVQSEIGESFIQIRQFLKEGKSVLFTGTPCQVAGLRNFIPQTQYKRLYCVDIICHGVPAPLVWEKYIHPFKPINNISFRDKRNGWKNFGLLIKNQYFGYFLVAPRSRVFNPLKI